MGSAILAAITWCAGRGRNPGARRGTMATDAYAQVAAGCSLRSLQPQANWKNWNCRYKSHPCHFSLYSQNFSEPYFSPL